MEVRHAKKEGRVFQAQGTACVKARRSETKRTLPTSGGFWGGGKISEGGRLCSVFGQNGLDPWCA